MEKKPNKFFSRMSNEELFEYVIKNHNGKTLKQLIEDESTVYNQVRKRKLLEELLRKKVLIKLTKRGLYERMNDNHILAYLEKRHKGKYMTDLIKDECSLYHVLRERGLIKKCLERKILFHKYRYNFFAAMEDMQLINFVKKNYMGKTLSKLEEDDESTYKNARERNLLEMLIDKGILVRSKVANKTWRDLNFALKEAKSFMEKENYSTLPSQGVLCNLGYSGLSCAIIRYHGGFPAFREKLREYLGHQSQKSELEGLIKDYILEGAD